MKLHFVDVSIIVGYIVLTFLIGFWISRKASKGMNSYFLGDNNIKWWMLGFSNSSGMFDVSGAAWMVSMVFIYGVNVYWQQWAWPVWNQVFLMMFLSIWLRRSNVMTGAEWINFRFGKDKGASASHIITVVFAVIVAVAFITYMTVGIGVFAAEILPWDLSVHFGNTVLQSKHSYAMIIIILTTLYSVKGGMYSVVATELIQYLIMIASCICITILAINLVSKETIDGFFPNGWKDLALKMKVDLDWESKWPAINKTIDDSGFRNFGFIFGLMAFKGLWASMAGPVPSYDMQRILSTKTPKEAAKMNAFTMIVLYFPLYLLVASVMVLGIHYFNISQMSDVYGVPELGSLLGRVIAQLPVGIKGLIMAGMLAAFMSTFSAFVNSGPAYIVNDIYKKYYYPNATQKKYIQISYLSSVILVIVGMLLGLLVKDVASMLDIITGGLYAGFVVPNVLKWVWWRLNGWGYFAGMATGITVSLITILFWKKDYGHIVISFPFNLVLSLIAAIVTSYFTKKQSVETLMHFYTNTKPWGFWNPIKNIALHQDVSFKPNKRFSADMFNIVVGIIWQMTMIIIPIYLVIRDMDKALLFVAIWVISSIVLYFSWYKKLDNI